jgi:hypothetical protein
LRWGFQIRQTSTKWVGLLFRWVPKTTFEELVSEMVREDLKSAERDELVKRHGFTAYDYHE